MKPHNADLRWQADPLADATVSAFIGTRLGDGASPEDRTEGFRRMADAQRAISQWTRNGDLSTWQPDAQCTQEVGQALRRYLDQASTLPDWADPARIARAEALFMQHGPTSCLMLFCASLPECYVLPDLSAVLHEAGQLEAHAEHRIRQTAAMVFPVMLRGGLTTAEGSGVAQILKVRLIHATIRHLILHADPSQVTNPGHDAPTGLRPSHGHDHAGRSLHERLHAMGWSLHERGLPCNQQELGYTLLTFHYVFLRGMRTVGIPVHDSDEAAYLHTWNVLGHVLGITGCGMASNMSEAREDFEALQAAGGLQKAAPDPRPALAHALMAVMQAYLPWRWLDPLPVLLTRKLCGPFTARCLGLDNPQPLAGRVAFAVSWRLVRAIDTLGRLFSARFSISGRITHVLGYRLLTRLLTDQTRPLRLPESLAPRVQRLLAQWRTHR